MTAKLAFSNFKVQNGYYMSNHIERRYGSEREEIWLKALYIGLASTMLLLGNGGSNVSLPPPERPPTPSAIQFTRISTPEFSYELPALPRPGPERPPEPPKKLLK